MSIAEVGETLGGKRRWWRRRRWDGQWMSGRFVLKGDVLVVSIVGSTATLRWQEIEGTKCGSAGDEGGGGGG
jgi:hypothetical protein